MKKFLVFAFISFAILVSCSLGVSAYAAENEQPEQAEEVEEKVGKVISNVSDGGDILLDITEGKVGEEVTAYIKPNFLFSVASIKINGADVEINDNGVYKFKLIEGDNTVDVEFKINNEKLAELAKLINQVKDNGFSSLFTMANLLNLISWIVSTIFTSGFFITLIKSKKLKAKTVDEVVEIVKGTLQSENAQTLKEFLNSLIEPMLDTLVQKIDSMDDCMKVFCRCFILAQDDTPENRLAIISELTKLKNSDEELTAQIRNIIREEQKAQEEKLVARDKAIETLEKNNAELIRKEDTEDSYGQL